MKKEPSTESRKGFFETKKKNILFGKKQTKSVKEIKVKKYFNIDL